MADVEGLTPEELEEQGATVEAVVAAALALVAEQAAASVLAGIPAVIGTGLPAYPWVSLDDVAIVPTLWLRQLDEQVMPAVRVVFDQTAEHVHGQIQAAVDANPTLYGTPEFDVPGEVVEPPPVPEIPDVTAEQLMAAARNRLVGIGDTLWADIRQQIVEGIGVGESIEQLGKRIEATAGVAEPRARTIARTEVVSTSNGAAIAQARSAGVPMTKSWLDTHDTRTRPTHKEAGRTQRRVPLDQPFEVGGFQLDFPGDPSGPPQEVINERCAIGFELGVPEPPVTAAVGRKTAADPYVRDADGQFAKTGTPDFAKMKVTDLRAELKQRGIKGLSKANKAQLVEALEQFDKGNGGLTEVERVDPPKVPKPRVSKTRPPAVEKPPDVLEAEQHARELTKSLPPSVRKDVLDSLIQQAALKPRSVRTLKGFEFRDLGNGGAQYLPDQRTIAINSRWKTHKRAMTTAGKASLEDGFLTPTGANSVLGAYIAHEFGHHVAFGRYSPSAPGLVKPFGDRVMGALSRAIGVSGPPPSRGANIRWPDVTSWMARNRQKLQTEVSEYGAESIHELLAELWQEYSTRGDKARSAAKAVGPILRGATPSVTPVVAAVGRKTAVDPYVRDSEGKFAETASAPSKLLTDLLAIPFTPSVEGEIGDSVRAAYSGKFAGFTVDSVSVRVRDGGAGIVGLVKDADGNTVGTVMRTLDLQDDDTVWAGHRYMQLDENLRGQGFAEAYNAHLIDWYRDNGVSAVELKAASSVGGYAHARAGYDWRDSKAAEGVVDRVRDAADPSRPRYSLQPAGGNMDRVPVERLPEQRRLAQEMVARFEGTRFGSDDYPTPFEVSQLGRWPGAGKDDMWVGKAIMLGSSWDGVKIL